MRFPLAKTVSVTDNSESFRTVDFSVATEIPVGTEHPGAFGVLRRHHVHEGVDLYALEGDPVYAMEGGVVTAIGPFTGPAAGFDWWLDTDFVMVEGDSGVLCYGEIKAEASLQIGDAIEAGRLLGTIATVLVKDKGRPRNMLHLEYYEKGVTSSCGVWPLNANRPEHLLDPTPLLLEAAGLSVD